MNNRTEAKLTDLSGMQKAIEEILKQAWERGRKYGQNEDRPQGEWVGSKEYVQHLEEITGERYIASAFNMLFCNNCWETPDSIKKTNFCPNCGAKMKGEHI